MLSPLSPRELLNWTADHFPLWLFGACFFGFLLRLNVCNDLAKAMKALDGKNGACFFGAFRFVWFWFCLFWFLFVLLRF